MLAEMIIIIWTMKRRMRRRKIERRMRKIRWTKLKSKNMVGRIMRPRKARWSMGWDDKL